MSQLKRVASRDFGAEGKYSEISSTFSFCSQISWCFFEVGIYKKLIKIANRTDPDQTASSEAV